MQNKIKENVKKATDLDIKEINIKVNDVEREENVPTKEESKAEKKLLQQVNRFIQDEFVKKTCYSKIIYIN